MATDTDIKAAQAHIARILQALDDVLTGRMRSGLEASTGAGSNRVGYCKPDVPALQVEQVRAKGDRSAVRRALRL